MPLKHKASSGTGLFSRLLFAPDPGSPDRNQGVWIVGLMLFESDPGLPAIRQRILECIVRKYSRYRSTLENIRGQPVFTELESEDELDWDYHVPDLSSLSIQTKEELFAYVGSLNDFQYDFHRPLWRFLHITLPGQSAIISCINHTLGDGLSLVDVIHSVYDSEAITSMPSQQPCIKHHAVNSRIDRVSKIGMFMYGIYFALTLLVRRPDEFNALRLKPNQLPTYKKKIALAEPISLDRVRDITHALPGTSINDVLMAVMSLTLRRLFSNKQHGSVTAQFPISTRPKGEGGLDKSGQPHNNVSFGFFRFDLDPTHSRIRIVWNTKHQIDAIKCSPSPFVLKTAMGLLLRNTQADGILNYFGITQADGLLTYFLHRNGEIATAMLSNVPAPSHQVEVCGVKALDMSFYVFSPLVCYLGILTYNHQMNASFNLDAALEVDPKELATFWNEEFELLHKEVTETATMQEKEEPPLETFFFRSIGVATLLCAGWLLKRAAKPFLS